MPISWFRPDRAPALKDNPPENVPPQYFLKNFACFFHRQLYRARAYINIFRVPACGKNGGKSVGSRDVEERIASDFFGGELVKFDGG